MRTNKYSIDMRRMLGLEFDSVLELQQHQCTRNAREAAQYMEPGTGAGHSVKWVGADGPTVRSRVTDGWPEGLERMRNMLGELDADLVVAPRRNVLRKRKKRRDSDGMTVDMDRVYQGDLDRAWTRMVHEPRDTVHNKTVSVFVNLSASAMIEPQQMMWRAAAVVATCDALARAGKSVRVWVGSAGTQTYQRNEFSAQTYSVLAKDYSEPLSMERVAAMCDSAFYRTHIFKAYCAYEGDRVAFNLGMPANDPSLLPKTILEERKAGSMVVCIGHAFNRDAARRVVENVREQLRQEGE